MQKSYGFTLAEVLIALALLGVVAAFSIPKILMSASNEKFNAMGKEFIGMFSGAQEKMKLEGTLVSGTTLLTTMFQSLNISRDTTAVIDADQGNGATLDCAAAPAICWRIPNGAVVYAGYDQKYVSGSLNAIGVAFDPDGKVTTGSPTGPGKSLPLWLYGTGELRTRANSKPSTVITSSTGATTVIDPGGVNPDWFSW